MSLAHSLPEGANQLSPKSITTSRIVVSIISLIPLGLGIFIAIASDEWTRLLFGLGATIVFFLCGWFWSKKSYHYRYWWFEEEGLYIQKGVIWRSRVFVPYNRVQHTDVSQGPLERKYTLGKLIIHTAGTKDSSVTLKGIEFDLAHKLRNQLIDDEQADAV